MDEKRIGLDMIDKRYSDEQSHIRVFSKTSVERMN